MSSARTPEDWHRSTTWIDQEGADVARYVASLKPYERPAYDLKAKLDEWHELGVVTFENIVDHALIERFSRDVEHILANHQKYCIPIDGSHDVAQKYRTLDRLTARQLRDYNVRLVNLHSISSAAARLAMVPEAVSFLTHVFGGPPALLQTLIFPKGSEQGEHQDFSFVFQQREIAKLAAFWIPLEDVHPDAGPLGYYCGSHKVDTLGFFDWGHGHINLVDCYEAEAADRGARYVAFLKGRVKELNLKPRHFLPKKGDILVWHGALVHTGTKINDQRRTRKSLVGHFTSVANHYRLDENHVNGGFVLDLPERDDVRTYERSLRGAARRTRTQMRRAYWSLRASVRRRASRPR